MAVSNLMLEKYLAFDFILGTSINQVDTKGGVVAKPFHRKMVSSHFFSKTADLITEN